MQIPATHVQEAEVEMCPGPGPYVTAEKANSGTGVGGAIGLHRSQ